MCDRAHYEDLEDRVTKLETAVTQMRTECQSGFATINTAVANLASEFGTRMNNLDKRIVEEKERWGDVLRSVVKWTTRALLATATAAAGVNLAKGFFA